MNNHVHFVMVPEEKEGISRLFNTVHMRYAQYKNYKKKTSGHLWQGRFFSCPCDNDHLFYVIRYVEQNPFRAKMVECPWDYEWSSAKWHVRKKPKKYIKINDVSIVDKKYWKQYLMNSHNNIDEQIRRKTAKGKAFAGEDFISYWEQRIGCLLRELKPGRKKKEKRE